MEEVVDAGAALDIAPEEAVDDDDNDADVDYLSSRAKARLCDPMDDQLLDPDEMVDLQVESVAQSK